MEWYPTIEFLVYGARAYGPWIGVAVVVAWVLFTGVVAMIPAKEVGRGE